MSKNVLILTGSPRKGGNSDILADAFEKGLKGHNVKRISVYDLKIGGCRACNGCWNNKGNCVFKDGMEQI